MNKLRAFVGHSFEESDESVINFFLNYFSSLNTVLEWDNAKRAEPKELSEQVKEKMEGENLFIGIFTLKNKQINHSKLKENDAKDSLCGNKTDFSWTTSDWVIQESGYAIGKSLKTIFLIEEGLGQIGGLQGDLQYIRFSRDNPSKCCTEINEMLTSLMKIRKESLATEELKEKANIYTSEVSSQPLEDTKEKDSFSELLEAIKGKNDKKEQELFNKYIENIKSDKFKLIDYTCRYYWLRHRFGGRNELESFQRLSKENPDHPSPHIWQGNLFEEYKNYDKAAEHFMKAAMYSKEESEKTTFLCRSSKALLQAKKYPKAEDRLLARLYEINEESVEEKHNILKVLAAIALERKDVEKYFSLAEKALDINPSDNELRFELARTYYSNSKHSMSLYHYKILCDNSPTTSNWNNLGVAYAELTLVGKAVSAYKRSEELGGTTAVGNLAHKLIDAGFLEEARKKLEDILKREEYDTNVPSALSTLENVDKTEEDKEDEILSSIDRERGFRVDYAAAYTSKFELGSLLKRWMSQFGELEVSTSERQFSASGKTVMQKARLGLLPYRQISSESEQDSLTRTVSYSGSIINRAIDFKLSIKTIPTKEYDRSTLSGNLLGEIAAINEKEDFYSGIMIIEDNCKKIRVMQKDSKGNILFYDLSAVGL